MYEKGMLENYMAWKAKRLEKVLDTNLINLFETNPTEEQILLISKYMRRKEDLWLLIAITYLITGMFAGFLWTLAIYGLI